MQPASDTPSPRSGVPGTHGHRHARHQAGSALVLAGTALIHACGGGAGSSSGGAIGEDVTLRWRAPLERVDGSPLAPSEIGGYILNIGPASGDYDQAIDLRGSGQTHYTLRRLRGPRIYLILRAYDTDGRLSPPSRELELRLG